MQIRTSALPGFNDCARRTVARVWRREVQGLGFELRDTKASIGAAVGTTVHGAARVLQSARMNNPGIPHDDLIGLVPSALRVGFEEFHEEIANGITWDDTTPNVMVAQQQTERMIRAYLPLLRNVLPSAVELSLSASIGDGWTLTGTVDLITATGHLDDLKTGYEKRPYHAQLGGYALLARSNGHDIRSVGTSFIERSRMRNVQAPLERQTYDLDVTERTAWSTLQRIKREVGEFMEHGTPDSITANPMSLMCRAQYCPAFGTSFCRLATERETVQQTPSEPNQENP